MRLHAKRAPLIHTDCKEEPSQHVRPQVFQTSAEENLSSLTSSSLKKQVKLNLKLKNTVTSEKPTWFNHRMLKLRMMNDHEGSDFATHFSQGETSEFWQSQFIFISLDGQITLLLLKLL